MERRCVEPSSAISARFICWQRSISRRVMCSANRRSTTKRTKPKPPWNCSKGWSFKAASSPATRCSANARSVRRSSTAAATISSSLKTTNPRCEPTSLLTFSQPFPPYTEQQRQKHLDTARVKNKGHGRLEEREVQLSTRIVPHLNWPGLAQVCRRVQTTVRKGKRTVGIDYAITSLGRDQASARWVAQCCARSLGNRKPLALRPRRHIRRGRQPHPKRRRSANPRRLPQYRHQPAPLLGLPKHRRRLTRPRLPSPETPRQTRLLQEVIRPGSDATRWWYCETPLLKSVHSRNRCDEDQTAMEIRHCEGGRMTHENLPRLLRRKQGCQQVLLGLRRHARAGAGGNGRSQSSEERERFPVDFRLGFVRSWPVPAGNQNRRPLSHRVPRRPGRHGRGLSRR